MEPILFFGQEVGIIGLSIMVIWALVWKGLGLYHSARNRQKIWFIMMLILNTLGILPIVYLLFFRKK